MKNDLGNLVCALTATLTFLFLVQTSLGQGQRQFVHFYSSPQCQHVVKTIHNSDYMVRLNVSSIKVNGMWKMSSCNSVICNNITTYISEGGCVPYLNNGSDTYLQAVRYGDESQQNASVTFFPMNNFTGLPETVVDIRGLNSTYNQLSTGSWFFTGNHQWSVYEKSNFTGKKTCLLPSSQIKSRGYGITFQTASFMLIGSVKYGCSSSASGIFCINITIYLLMVLSVFKSF